MSKHGEKFDVLIVGGGASGMMAACRAAERGKRVLLLEKNSSLGEKLKITGGGRCNITNAEFDTNIFLKHYGVAEQFLRSPFSQFGVQSTFDFFASHGLPLVVQNNKRAFPESQSALDVSQLFEFLLNKGGVTVLTNTAITDIDADGKRIVGIRARDEYFIADSVILATGGLSHQETGSTGDGFAWLSSLGHTVKDPTPTIVPLAVRDKWVKSLAGVTVSPIKITFFVDGKKQLSRAGEVLFTHFGLSGPTILNSAGQVGDMLQAGVVTASIDVFPNMDLGALDAYIINIFDANKNKSLKNVLKEIAPPGMAVQILSLLPRLNGETKANSVTKEERKAIVHMLKALPITITRLMGLDRAVVADGGVALEEIDMKRMRSNLYDNLYITGDLLHITRPSGGYSLQLCWTTGYVAGSYS